MAKEPLNAGEIRKPLTAQEIRRRMAFYVHEIGNGPKTARDLSLEEVEDAFRLLFEGRCSEAQAAAFLVALRIKGSADDERLGLLNVLREYNEPPAFAFSDLLDYSGFYDGRNRELHLSPAIALVAAAAGARVVLTGGNSRNLNTLHRVLLQGVLRELGVRVDASLHEVGEGLRHAGVGFIDAHMVNRALNNPNMDRIREDVGLRTPLNTMEISLNPANAPYHIRGIFHPRSREQIARIMARCGIKRGLMLSGVAGSGEVLTHRPSEAFEVRGEQVSAFTLDPARFGLEPGSRGDLLSPDARDQSGKLVGILEGKIKGSLRDVVVLNAGLVLHASEKADSIEVGIRSAQAALDSEKPLRLLEAWRKI